MRSIAAIGASLVLVTASVPAQIRPDGLVVLPVAKRANQVLPAIFGPPRAVSNRLPESGGTARPRMGSSCLAMNEGNNPSINPRFGLLANKWFALQVSAPLDTRISGFSLWSKYSTTTRIKTAVFPEVAGKRPGSTPLATGTMPLTTKQQWNFSKLSTQLTFRGGLNYYLAWQAPTTNFMQAALQNGDTGTHFFDGPTNWRGSFGDGKWGFMVNCVFEPDGSEDVKAYTTIGTRLSVVPGSSTVQFENQRTLKDQRIQVDLMHRFASAAEFSPANGLAQILSGEGLPGFGPGAVKKATLTSNQPRALFPATYDGVIDFVVLARYMDLCPRAGIRLLNPTVTKYPPVGTSYTPASATPTSFTEACTGKGSLATMKLNKVTVTAGPSKQPPPTVLENRSSVLVTGNATGSGNQELVIKVAPGEPGAGDLVVSSGPCAVRSSMTAAQTAACLAAGLTRSLATNRPCCPMKVELSGSTVVVRSRSLRRFACWIGNKNLDLGSATRLGQTFTKSKSRHWQALAPTGGKVAFSGRGCSLGSEPELHAVIWGVPKLDSVMQIGVSTTRSNQKLPYVMILGAQAVNLPIGGGCTLYTAPLIIVPLPAAPHGTTNLPFPIPNDRKFLNAVIHWQGVGFDLKNSRFITSDRLTTQIGPR